MSTDPTALELALQAQMAQLLAFLPGQLQALLTQLNAAAAAFQPQAPGAPPVFGPIPGDKPTDTVAIDPAVIIQPGPPPMLWASEAPIPALPIPAASGIAPPDLRQEVPVLMAWADPPAPAAMATPSHLPGLLPAAAIDPAPAWCSWFDRQGDGGEGSDT